jgi:hypothetical protein
VESLVLEWNGLPAFCQGGRGEGIPFLAQTPAYCPLLSLSISAMINAEILETLPNLTSMRKRGACQAE